jgi:hypothetical protein
MSLGSAYLLKAYQFNLLIVLSVSNQILILDLVISAMGIEICLGWSNSLPSYFLINQFRLWSCFVHFIGPWSIWLSTCNHSYRWSISLYIVTLLNPFVSCEISYWLRLVMVLWLKPMVPRRNRGPPVNVHTWLCCSARAGVMVSSCNPLWDYINMLSGHNLVLPCMIHYWCFLVTVSWLWLMVPPRNWEPLVNVHTRLCCLAHAGIEVFGHDSLWNYSNMSSSVYLFLEMISMLFVKWSSNIYHLCWIKRAYHSNVLFNEFTTNLEIFIKKSIITLRLSKLPFSSIYLERALIIIIIIIIIISQVDC